MLIPCLRYIQDIGIKFGNNVRITSRKVSFGGEPYLVEIGSDVTITPGVKFQSHDGGVGLFRDEFPGINVLGRIKVGNNVFIGEDAMILPGVTIGDNVIVGARSLVTRNIPSDSVAAGVPAKVIRTIQEYKDNSLKKAIYVHGKDPAERKIEILRQLDQ